jgi:hypothetical protein
MANIFLFGTSGRIRQQPEVLLWKCLLDGKAYEYDKAKKILVKTMEDIPPLPGDYNFG